VFVVASPDGAIVPLLDQKFNEKLRDLLFADAVAKGEPLPTVQPIAVDTTATDPQTLVLSGFDPEHPPTDAELEAALAAATGSGNVLGHVLAAVLTPTGELELTYELVVPDDGSVELASVQAEAGSPVWLAKLASQLGGGVSASPKPVQQPPVGTVYTSGSLQLGLPVDEIDPATVKQLLTDLADSGTIMGFGEFVIAPGELPGTSNIVFSAAVAPDDATALADELNSQSFREELRDALLDPAALADAKSELPFVEPVAVLDGKLTPPVSVTLDGLSEAPTPEQLQQAVEAALAGLDPSLDPALVDILAVETGPDGAVDVVFRVAGDTTASTDELAAALSTPDFLDALATDLNADSATVEAPGGDIPTPEGSQWTDLSTVSFGAPTDEISQADFIAAVLDTLQQAGIDGALYVDVLSLTDGTTAGVDPAVPSGSTDIVFSVLATDEALEAISELVDTPEFRQMLLENLFEDADELPTVSAIPVDSAPTTPIQTVVIPASEATTPRASRSSKRRSRSRLPPTSCPTSSE